MNVYCYNVRDALTGVKLIGGTMHAMSMDDAAKRVIKRCKIEVEKIEHERTGYTTWNMKMKGKLVYAYVGIHPEYLNQ